MPLPLQYQTSPFYRKMSHHQVLKKLGPVLDYLLLYISTKNPEFFLDNNDKQISVIKAIVHENLQPNSSVVQWLYSTFKCETDDDFGT